MASDVLKVAARSCWLTLCLALCLLAGCSSQPKAESTRPARDESTGMATDQAASKPAFDLVEIIKGKEGKPKIDRARVEIVMLSKVVATYHIRYDQYPPSLASLTRPMPNGSKPYLEASALVDPWGREYQYANPPRHNTGQPDIWSLGPDPDNPAGILGNWSSAAGRTAPPFVPLTDDGSIRAAIAKCDVGPGVPVRGFSQEVRFMERRHACLVLATQPDYAKVNQLELAVGRFLTDDDDRNQNNVAVLGPDAADSLFPAEDPVGKSIIIAAGSYRIVGVIRKRTAQDVFIPLQSSLGRSGKPTSVSNGFEVTLHVNVSDTDGKPLDTRPLTIEVMEDGKPVPAMRLVTGGPARICLVMDYSASMSARRKIDAAKKASLALLESLRGANDCLGIWCFNGRLNGTKTGSSMERLPLGPLGPFDSERRQQARDAIENTPQANGTPMYAAMKQAAEAMARQPGQQVMVVLSDGLDTDSKAMGEASKTVVLKLCKERGIPVYMITFPGRNKDAALEEMARETGGKHLTAALPDDPTMPEDLQTKFLEIGQAAQNQLVLEYNSPSQVLDGRQREVVVTVRSGTRGTQARVRYQVGGVMPP